MKVENQRMDLSHLEERIRHKLKWDDRSRIRSFRKPEWINYREASEIFARMEKLLNITEKKRNDGLLIWTPANNGKSSLLRKFLEKHPVNIEVDESGCYIPVVLIDSPPEPDISWLLNEILVFLNAPYKQREKPEGKIRQIQELFRRLGVKMLIIDEISDMVSGSANKQRVFLRFIKQMSTRFEIPIVLSGTKDIVSVIATDKQVDSRFKKIELPEWKMDGDLVGLLAAFEKLAPLKNPSHLILPENRDIVAAIHEKSLGRIGWITEILEEAVEMAIISGEERITKDIISRVKI